MSKMLIAIASIMTVAIMIVSIVSSSETDGTEIEEPGEDVVFRIYSDDGTIQDVSTDTQGTGWTFTTTDGVNELTLNGYNGGAIQIYKQLDITVIGENKVTGKYPRTIAAIGSTSHGYGGPNVSITGQEGSMLEVESNLWGIYCNGSLTIRDCNIGVFCKTDEVSDEAISSGTRSTYQATCIQSGDKLTISGCQLNLETVNGTDTDKPAYGCITGLNVMSVTDCTVTASSPSICINAQNQPLTIEDCILGITVPQEQAGNVSPAGILNAYGSKIEITGCIGSIKGYVGITGQRSNCDIAVSSSQLEIDSSYYGIMNLLGDNEFVNSNITITNAQYGIYGTKQITGTGSNIDATDCLVGLRHAASDLPTNGYGWLDGLVMTSDWFGLSGEFEPQAEHIRVLENNGSGKGMHILPGANIDLGQDIVYDASGVSSMTVWAGAVLTNLGILSASTIENQGIVRSVCTSQLEVTTGSNPVEYIHDWGSWNVTTEPQIGVAGEETRICNSDPAHSETRAIDPLIPADYSAVEEAIERAEGLDPDDYVDFSPVTDAVGDVVEGLDSTRQEEVDAMADAINDAIDALVPKTDGSDPTDPDTPIFVPDWDDDALPLPPQIVVEETEDDDDLWLFVVLGSVATFLFLIFVIHDRRNRD